jgi:NDP-sugar pyrophosphorylase family protein
MKIVIPMSGRGNRFLQSGYKIPKTLLQVDGRPVIQHVINMFPGEDDFIFICNEDDIENTDMQQILKDIKPEGKIKVIASHKKGPVFAVTQVFDEISDGEPILISYCDYSQDWDYEKFKKDIARLDPDGAIPSYTGFHPHLLRKNLYAGILADENCMMMDIKEKHCFTENPEDSFHSGGSYYFKSGSLLKKSFGELIDRDINLNGEYYVSMAYYLLKRDGLRIFIPKIEYFMQWGTPEDLEEYESWSRYFYKEFIKEKGVTEIPVERERLVKIPYKPGGQEFVINIGKTILQKYGQYNSNGRPWFSFF